MMTKTFAKTIWTLFVATVLLGYTTSLLRFAGVDL
jgi:hypothetical protein